MNKYKYTLNTLSKVILSPRDHNGFYESAGDFRKENINIIYPFYQYGAYDKYDPERASYYIPGSSIKGAILSNLPNQQQGKIIVDDVHIKNYKDIEISKLKKIQYISEDTAKSANIKEFFPNVGVEMLNKKVELNGEIFSKNEIGDYFSLANQRTISILEQYKNKTDNITFDNENSEGALLYKELKENISGLLEKIKKHDSIKCTIILGGYKGLLLSKVFKTEVLNKDFNSAVYVDDDAKLPYGLVTLTLN